MSTSSTDSSDRLVGRVGLAGRVAVIAGGGGGLGRACALELGRAGMALVLCDRDVGLLAQTAAELRDDGVDVVEIVGDVRDPDVLDRAFETCDEHHGGGLDALVNVVGGTFQQAFEETTPSGWDALIRTNFTWVLHAIQRAIPRMRSTGGGSIINLTSIEAHRAAPGYAVYAAMKAAVTSLSATLAVELGPDSIRVNNIAADYTPTATTDRLARPSGEHGRRPGIDEMARTIAVPMGRAGTFADIGGCALFLASDLSSFVTGQTLHPDGGASASMGWHHWPGDGWRVTPPDRAVEPYL